MIVYKYVSYDVGLKILENNSIGFSKPGHFNDPFEVKAASYDPKLLHGSDDVRAGFQIMASAMQIVGGDMGILSLTRAPLNSLMWAHYGAHHTGMVIGIDGTISELASERMNLLPIQFGSVIYTNTRPRAPLVGRGLSHFGTSYGFEPKGLEHFQRLFLFKPMCWSYEEEVRVVKNVRGTDESAHLPSGHFSVISVTDATLYLLHLPQGAVREVVLGARSQPVLQSRGRTSERKKFLNWLSPLQPRIDVFGCKLSDSTWNLERYLIKRLFTSTLDES